MLRVKRRWPTQPRWDCSPHSEDPGSGSNQLDRSRCPLAQGLYSILSGFVQDPRVGCPMCKGRGRASAACLYWSGPDHRYPKGSAMQLPRPCLDCQRPTPPGRSRCPQCLRLVRRTWDEASQQRRKQRTQGGGAARRLRYKINKVGFADCQTCGNTFTSQLIEVDHIQPVALGGSDADEGNVRPLCLQCHSLRPIPRPRAK